MPTPLNVRLTGSLALELRGSFTWDPAIAPSLHDLRLEVLGGQLVAVVGATGALLFALCVFSAFVFSAFVFCAFMLDWAALGSTLKCQHVDKRCKLQR